LFHFRFSTLSELFSAFIATQRLLKLTGYPSSDYDAPQIAACAINLDTAQQRVAPLSQRINDRPLHYACSTHVNCCFCLRHSCADAPSPRFCLACKCFLACSARVLINRSAMEGFIRPALDQSS
jgi:hypothetical protein